MCGLARWLSKYVLVTNPEDGFEVMEYLRVGTPDKAEQITGMQVGKAELEPEGGGWHEKEGL